MAGVKTLSTTRVYANERMSVREDTVRYPDGSTGIYSVVDSADIALAIPLQGERIHLVEQFRYPVGGRRWEFPSGAMTLDSTLDQRTWLHVSCAKRQGSSPKQ
jgi:hypothetical protein